MRPIAAVITTLAACAALSACALPTVDKEAEAMARALYEQVRTGADLAANPDLGPEMKTSQSIANLAEATEQLPNGAPSKVSTRSWNINMGTDGTKASLVQAYVYPSATILAETVLVKGEDKRWKVIGFHLKDGTPEAPPPAVTVEKTQET